MPVRRMWLLPVILVMATSGAFLAYGRSGPRSSDQLFVVVMALLSFPAAYLGARVAAGAGPSDLSRESTLRWAGLFPSLVFAVGLVVLVLAPSGPAWLGPALAALISVLTFVAAAKLWLLPLRPIFRMRQALADPSAVEPAARALVDSFERTSAPAGGVALRRRAHRALAAVAVLSEARRWTDARRVLEAVPVEKTRDPQRPALQASRALVLLYDGDRNGAWAALKDAFAHARQPDLVRVMTITDALMSALDKHGEAALERLAELPEPTEPRIRRAWLITRAHAFSANGDEAAARATLEELAKLAPDGLERVKELGGPASELAERMLRNHEKASRT